MCKGALDYDRPPPLPHPNDHISGYCCQYCRPALVPLHGAFMGNPALNGVILGALLLGVIYVIRQTLRLSPEQRWLVGVQKTAN